MLDKLGKGIDQIKLVAEAFMKYLHCIGKIVTGFPSGTNGKAASCHSLYYREYRRLTLLLFALRGWNSSAF